MIGTKLKIVSYQLWLPVGAICRHAALFSPHALSHPLSPIAYSTAIM